MECQKFRLLLDGARFWKTIIQHWGKETGDMNNRILSRRGSTLIEMIIAMALLSIVSVMIVSFSAMAHSFTNDETQKAQLYRRLRGGKTGYKRLFAYL